MSGWKKLRRALLVALALAVVALVLLVGDEVQSSRWQARALTRLAGELHFELGRGPSNAIRFPGAGPYDQRLGYTQLPQRVQQLQRQGFEVTAQARMSPRMIELRDKGVFTPYREKDWAGLEIADCRGQPMYSTHYPQHVYERFDLVPPLLVDALLFIENRELLDSGHPMRNPAVEWDRFTMAAFDQAWRLIDDSQRGPGGSTLATQLEKYRHSPEGRTDSGKEKLRQMASGSIRAYLDGPVTLPWRRQLVRSYLNTVPLSAKAGFGEVNGLGEGLWAWYGRDFEQVNRLLRQPLGSDAPLPPVRRSLAFKPPLLPQQALAFKQALSLMIAQRRPSHYLVEGEDDLRELTDSYLRVMADAGVIPPQLRDAALPIRLQLRRQANAEPQASFIDRKAANAVRGRLASLMDLQRAYDLDRLDLRAASTLDSQVQRAATQLLRSLRDPAAAKAAGLYGFRLLKEGDDTSKLTLSFTLFERTPKGNLLRVQTDNVDQPFDLNEGARLDLGSTSKLRTLVTYLELIAEMHQRWSGLDRQALQQVQVHPKDPLAQWSRDYLLHAEDTSLKAMLDAAMDRRYSGSTGETFFTGGGAHHFVNFEREEDFQTFTVRDALKHSVNLAFIRIMRDVVYHVMAESPQAQGVLQDDAEDPARQLYLSRFADKEGREFLGRFYAKLQSKGAAEAEALLLQDARKPTPARLAAMFYALEPDADAPELAEFLARHGDAALSDSAVQALHDKYGPERWSISDRGYLAGVHPLELWLAGYLRHHPKATFSDAVAASKEVRQEVYTWLFKTRHKSAQDVRIRQVVEQEAFAEIARRWRRLGYPFAALTPSYAAALGASGDRPAALAEFMGILVNHGVRLPTRRVTGLHFAADTPYETQLQVTPAQGERVLPAEVADTAREAAIGVVEGGTAGRLHGVFVRPDGTPVPVGGKTGTGDHRFDVYGRHGELVSQRVVNRTATFVFFIGDRYFGTMMAYVHEPYAAKYKFTSALPAQLLKALSPALLPLLDQQRSCGAPVLAAR